MSTPSKGITIGKYNERSDCIYVQNGSPLWKKIS